MTVYLIHRTYKKFYADGKLIEHEKNIMKYFIYLTAFTLEDCGQVFLQFYYYERFDTKINFITIVNGSFMVLMSFKSMVDMAKYSVDRDNGLYK